MNVKISYVRAAMGWDITICVSPDHDETVTHVKTIINGFTADDQDVIPPASGWQIVLRQKGAFPGNNNVMVTVTDQSGKDTHWQSQWS